MSKPIVSRKKFLKHLQWSKKVCAAWPDWKREVAGLWKQPSIKSGYDTRDFARKTGRI